MAEGALPDGRAFRIVLWLAAIVAAGTLIYGFATTNLFTSETWSVDGAVRFGRYTRIFVLAYLALAVALRRYLRLVIAVAVVGITVVAMGPTPVLSVVLLVISCAVLGRSVFRASDWALSFLAGLCVWALAIALLASWKVHYVFAYAGVHAAVLLLRWREAFELLRDLRDVVRPSSNDARLGTLLGLGAFLYAFLAQWLLVWKPETGGDALAMHLAIALDFANNHAFTFDYHRYIWALAPLGADFCYAAAAVLGGEPAARLLNLTMFGMAGYLIYRSSRFWLPSGVAFLLAALFASAPMAQLVTGTMMVENFTAALAIGAAYALWRFHEQPSGGMLCLCAFLLGSGIGWKLGGLAVAAGLFPFLLVSVVRRWRGIAGKRALVACAAALLFCVPAFLPYTKAYILTGNPMFPFGDRWKSPLIQENLTDFRYQQPLTWHTPFDLTFYTQRYYEGQDGSFGFHYLFLFAISLVALWRLRAFSERSAVIGGMVAAAGVALAQPNARYFYPALPIVMVGGAAALGLVRSVDRSLFVLCVTALGMVGALNMHFLPTSNWYHRDFYMRPLFAERGRLEYLRGNAPVREVVRYVNRTRGGVVFVQNSDVAGVRLPFFSNHWHNLPFRKAVEGSRRAVDFYKVVRSNGIQHFIKHKTVSEEDVKASPALFEFLDICGEPEHETDYHVVLRVASNCERRLVDGGPKFATRVLPPGKYDDNDPRMTYLGDWQLGRDFDGAYERTVSYINQEGAEIRFEFEGTAFVYGFAEAPNRGQAQVFIDGQPAELLDQYGSDVQWSSGKRYAASGRGRHSVMVRVTHGKQPASQEYFVDLDFVVVEP